MGAVWVVSPALQYAGGGNHGFRLNVFNEVAEQIRTGALQINNSLDIQIFGRLWMVQQECNGPTQDRGFSAYGRIRRLAGTSLAR